MQDLHAYLVVAISGIMAISILSLTALRAWRDWLEFRRAELDRGPAERHTLSIHSRIEFADLKERIRKLEAIAAGVDI